MKLRFHAILVLVLTTVLFGLSGTRGLAEGKLIAVYGEAAVLKEPPPGWRFLWNVKSGAEISKDDELLSFDEKAVAYGVRDEAGALRVDMPGSTRGLDILTTHDEKGLARCYVAAYTLQTDSEGDVWINNGNLRNKSFPGGATLEISVNHALKFKSVAKRDRAPVLFQQNLGKLSKGDFIRVAVGPGEKGNGGGRLYFNIEEYPVGETPGAPVNILWPAFNATQPQLGVDGKINKGFLEKHKAQCAEALSKNPELVFIGDSITARWPQELLEQQFGKFRPVNLGVGGDWIQNVLWRVQNGVWDQIHPKVVVLLIGTNNVTHDFTPDEITQGINDLLKAIHEKVPESKILLQAILPRGASVKDGKNETIRQVNAKLANLANNKNVFFLDVGDKLVEPDGSISPEVMPDKLHVTMPGFIRWMEPLAPLLNQLLEVGVK